MHAKHIAPGVVGICSPGKFGSLSRLLMMASGGVERDVEVNVLLKLELSPTCMKSCQ